MSTVPVDISALAQELLEAKESGRGVAVPPSAREGGLTLDAAYAVEAELTRARRDRGRITVGRKVGYANKAVWRALKLQTLVWANMYDTTVRFAERGSTSLSLAGMHAPRLEPEIVVKLKGVPASGDAAALRPGVARSERRIPRHGTVRYNGTDATVGAAGRAVGRGVRLV